MSVAVAFDGRPLDRDAFASTLARRLTDVRTCFSVGAPLVAAERAVAAFDGDGAAFVSAEGEAFVGLELLRISGPELEPARSALRATFSSLPVCAEPRERPFVFAALPFEREPRDDSAYGFYLPRVAYRVREGRATITVVGTSAERARIERALARLLDALATPPGPVRARIARVVDSDEARFLASVAAAEARIEAGGLRKVVLARRVVAELDGEVSAAPLLAALGDRAPGCHRFALQSRASLFAGASPERLCRTRAGVVSTEALAGTSVRATAQALLASEKDGEEHAAVVDAIVSRLAGLVPGLARSSAPGLRQLRELAHLLTTFEGRLAEGRDALDVVEALHPTPAVGGVPHAEALAFVAAEEPFERGSYAGPLGVIDSAGDADFVVGLRSATFAGRTMTALAGAGIVRGSVAARELEETSLKLRTMLEVMGAPSA